MEDISVFCPLCKQQQTVNSSEEVIFCSSCNKPFSVKDAIKQHTEYLERREASKKPSDEAITKFNAILAQDYKLAEKYLEDVINKEYAQNCKKYLIFRLSLNSTAVPISSWQLVYQPPYKCNSNAEEIRKRLDSIRSVNSYIAEMYYKILCANASGRYKGELAFLKIHAYNIQNRLKEIYERSHDQAKEVWFDISNDIRRYKHWLEQEYDDEYIIDLIATIKDLSKKLSSICSDVHIVLTTLTSLLSLKGHEKMKYCEEEKKYKELLNKEVAFWKNYITLLNIKNINEAYKLLKNKSYRVKNIEPYKSEFAKFKKTLLGAKYLGDVSLLRADTLAELSVNNLK